MYLVLVFGLGEELAIQRRLVFLVMSPTVEINAHQPKHSKFNQYRHGSITSVSAGADPGAGGCGLGD